MVKRVKLKEIKKIKNLSLLFGFLSAAGHLGTADVAALVNEIQVAGFFLDADFFDFLGLGVTFLAAGAGHLGAANIAFTVNKVKPAFLFLHANFCYFFCHFSPPKF